MNINLWQDAVLSQYAEELDTDKLILKTPFIIKHQVIVAATQIQSWWRRIEEIRFRAATKLSAFFRGFFVRLKFF